jgi:hypothetical protein
MGGLENLSQSGSLNKNIAANPRKNPLDLQQLKELGRPFKESGKFFYDFL